VTSAKPWAAGNEYLVEADVDGRTRPQSEPRAKTDWLRKGQWVTIQCQIRGELAYGSRIWDKVGGYFVPDQFPQDLHRRLHQRRSPLRRPTPGVPAHQPAARDDADAAGRRIAAAPALRRASRSGGAASQIRLSGRPRVRGSDGRRRRCYLIAS
jgi:hypothetical protein